MKFYHPLFLIAMVAFLQTSCNNTNKSTWNADNYAEDALIASPITTSEAGRYDGKTVTVIGTVKSTYFAENAGNRPTFINLDKPFPDNPMTIILYENDVKALAFDRFMYENKQVTITGKIEQFQDEFGKIRPAIHIIDASQIAIKH